MNILSWETARFRTAALVAKHLQSLGIEVTTNVAVTGVVGILKGGQPGPVVALRAEWMRYLFWKKRKFRLRLKLKPNTMDKKRV